MQAAGMSDGGAYTDATSAFVLKHPDDVDCWVQNKQYLPEGLIFVSNASRLTVARPMANVEWISEIVMWVAVGATILIISLLSAVLARPQARDEYIWRSAHAGHYCHRF